MNDLETTNTNEATDGGPDGQQREWVTPAFEQVALKDALGAPGQIAPIDAPFFSS